MNPQGRDESGKPTPMKNAGFALAAAAAFLPLLAIADATAPIALVAARLLMLLGVSLMGAQVLLERRADASSSLTHLPAVALGALLGGAFGEGLSRLVSRPLSEEIYPGATAVVLACAAAAVTLRRGRPGPASVLLGLGALAVMGVSSLGLGTQSASLLSFTAMTVIPVAAAALIFARTRGADRLSTRSRVVLGAVFLFGFVSFGQAYAALRATGKSTDGNTTALVVMLVGALFATLLSVLPGRLFKSSALTGVLALPLVLSLISSAASALVPLEIEKDSELFRAESRLVADTRLLEGMTSAVGAGPRDKYRGFDFYECDAMSSRDCFITYYDEIALKQGVAAAVADLVDKVHNNKGSTFPAHCHQVAHNLGQMAFMLGDTFDDAAVLDPQVCGTGYTHGLWEQQFDILGTDVMFQRTGTLCEDLNMISPWYKWTCHHILGHMMAAKSALDPGMAAEYCTKVESPQDQTDCQTGAWMNFFQDDAVIAKMRANGSMEDLFGVCWGAPEDTKFFCYQELFPVIYKMIDFDDYAAGKACLDYAEPTRGEGDPWMEDTKNYADRCIQGLARGIGASAAQNYLLMRDRCLVMPQAANDACLTAAAASYVLNTGAVEPAFTLCREVRDVAYREYCYFWTKYARRMLANGPNSENLPDAGELRLPEYALESSNIEGVPSPGSPGTTAPRQNPEGM